MPIHSFPPIADARARVLILGSMPGVASLRAQQYYGHPRNAFWPIMAELFGFDALAPYDRRCRALREHRIALWDVLASCERGGSLDSAIDADSVVANDFARFYSAHRRIERVFFNGTAAQTLYRRHVSASARPAQVCDYLRLPSTSPANAAVSLPTKLNAWTAALVGAGAANMATTNPSGR